MTTGQTQSRLDSSVGGSPVAVSAASATEPEGISAAVDPQWASSMASAVSIPERAFVAYAGAARRIELTQPTCRLDWAVIAAVGYVESEHGTTRGGRIDSDGVQRPGLVGPALDGGKFARILDTDGGALDGDSTYDRAVGPLQFIAQTWRDYGRDGNGDGVADPQNIDDAAFSAAQLLCQNGGDLTTADGWIAATMSYNNSVDYNNQVAAITDQYRTTARRIN